MTETSGIEAATKRLALALDALDASVARRQEADLAEAGLTAQLQDLGTDRARLADELDTAIARSHALETSNRDIAQRLDAAIVSIRSVVDAHDR